MQRMKNVLKPTVVFGKGSEKAPSSLLFNTLPLISTMLGSVMIGEYGMMIRWTNTQ